MPHSLASPPETDFLAYFDREFAPKLVSRASTFRIVVEALLMRQAPLIIETGCARSFDGWAGDGQSTMVFDWLAQATNGRVISIDISENAIKIARMLTSERVTLIHADSIKMLAGLEDRPHLLYLDSHDLDPDFEWPAASHQLFEFCAAQRLLSPDTLVFSDDTWLEKGKWRGKGKLLCEYLERTGARLIAENGIQAIWQRTVK
jgi:SAM-dependent methyltransferase